MDNLRERFCAAQVLVVGDVMLDEYVVGVVSRISPEAPVPVLDVRARYVAAGGAANVAMNISSLGATVFLAGIIGEDSAGTSLRQLLPSDEYLITDPGRGTISKTRIVAGQQQICRIDHEVRSSVTPELLKKLLDKIDLAIQRCDIIVLSDYAKGVLSDECCAEVIHRSAIAGKPVIVDPKSRDFRKYRGCYLITPNQQEASSASGIPIDSEEALHQAGAKLLSELPGTTVLITRGADGMALFPSNDSGLLTIPTEASKVFDVVGAGDTVLATLAVALAAQVPIADAVRLANLAAGIAVEKPGTATVNFDELATRHLSRS